jgi:hypothetical protein
MFQGLLSRDVSGAILSVITRDIIFALPYKS